MSAQLEFARIQRDLHSASPCTSANLYRTYYDCVPLAFIPPPPGVRDHGGERVLAPVRHRLLLEPRLRR